MKINLVPNNNELINEKCMKNHMQMAKNMCQFDGVVVCPIKGNKNPTLIRMAKAKVIWNPCFVYLKLDLTRIEWTNQKELN